MDHSDVTTPGTRVTVHYRNDYRNGGIAHVGTVLAPNDPRAWVGSLAFYERTVDQASVDAYLATREPVAGYTPIAWDFGIVYWEPTHALRSVLVAA